MPLSPTIPTLSPSPIERSKPFNTSGLPSSYLKWTSLNSMLLISPISTGASGSFASGCVSSSVKSLSADAKVCRRFVITEVSEKVEANEASRAEGSSVSEESSGAAVEEQTAPGTIRYSDIAERISQNAASDALDKQLDALKHTEMSVLTRDSIVYQIRLYKIGREKAAAEMTRAAQKAYTDIIRLDGSIESLKGALKKAERMIAALKIRKKYNLVTQLELDEAERAYNVSLLDLVDAWVDYCWIVKGLDQSSGA